MVVPSQVTNFVLSGENALVISKGQTQRLVNEVSSRGEHGFAGQRTRFEGQDIILEHMEDVVDELLRETHAVMVEGLFGRSRRPLGFSDERSCPSAKVSD